ncbi:MAG: MBL fold metallo-hydrolase [Candidatus Thorarchaeota archaeon]|nr:MBL fold metallo-hydrolase [Candidatus Thorarchaeota archaeon]
MSKAESICPYCYKKTESIDKCTECAKSLLMNFKIKNKRYVIRVAYQDWDWRPTKVYETIIQAIVEKHDRSSFTLENLIKAVWADNEIPADDKYSIHSFLIMKNFDKYPVVQVRIRRGTTLFNHIERYAKEFGVYLYITGPPLPRELISCWLDKKEKIATHPKPFKLKANKMNKWASAKQLVEGGQSSMKLKLGGLRILLDAGFFWPSERSMECSDLLDNINPSQLDMVVISHAHADHIQGLVDLYEKHGCTAPIVTTRATVELGLARSREYQEIVEITKKELEKEDDYNALSREEQESKQLEKASKLLDRKFSKLLEKIVFVTYGETLEFDSDFSIKILQAGHYPGGIMTLFQLEDYSVLYTGDFNLLEFEPIASGRSALRTLKVKPDVVICDGSAADLEFPKESSTRARLYIDILDTYNRGGVTLLLSDHNVGAIITYFIIRQGLIDKEGGRIPFYFDSATWEQMCILRDRADDLDPIIRERIENHADPFHSAMIRRLEAEYPHLGGIGLKNAIKSRCVVSMDARLHGKLSPDRFEALQTALAGEDNLIAVIGAPRSSGTQDLVAGRRIVEVGLEDDNTYHKLQVNCRVLNWDFESHQIFNYHPDRDQLMEFFDSLTPKRVVFFHNPPNAFIDIRREISKRPYIEDHEVLHRHNRLAVLRDDRIAKDLVE